MKRTHSSLESDNPLDASSSAAQQENKNLEPRHKRSKHLQGASSSASSVAVAGGVSASALAPLLEQLNQQLQNVLTAYSAASHEQFQYGALAVQERSAAEKCILLLDTLSRSSSEADDFEQSMVSTADSLLRDANGFSDAAVNGNGNGAEAAEGAASLLHQDESWRRQIARQFAPSRLVVKQQRRQPLDSIYIQNQGVAAAGARTGLYLPQNICMLIVSFLPASSLMRCYLVNKTWSRACVQRGAIQKSLVFDHQFPSTWDESAHWQLLRRCLLDDANKLSLVSSISFVPNKDELESFDFDQRASNLCLALQITEAAATGAAAESAQTNTHLRSLAWKSCSDMELGEDEIAILHKKYPNLTSLELDQHISLESLFQQFPALEQLSTLAIDDADIVQAEDELSIVPSIRKLHLQENESDVTLHYICYCFPNLEDLLLSDMHDYSTNTEITIQKRAPVKKRKLKDLPVPNKLRSLKMVQSGVLSRDMEFYDDFLNRLSGLESLSLDAEEEIDAPRSSCIETVIKNNSLSLQELDLNRYWLSQDILRDAIARCQQLRKLNFTLDKAGDLVHLAELKDHLEELRITSADSNQNYKSFTDAAKAISSMEKLRVLHVPCSLQVDFNGLSRLEELVLSGRAPLINIKNKTLHKLDLEKATIFFCKVSCPKLRSFLPSRELIVLELNAPLLEEMDPLAMDMHNLYTMNIKSNVLSKLTLNQLENVETLNIDLPMLRELSLGYGTLKQFVTLMKDSNMASTVLPRIRKISINDSTVQVDKTFVEMLQMMPCLHELSFQSCGFNVPPSAEANVDETSTVPAIKMLRFYDQMEFLDLARVMATIFPNIEYFQFESWQDEELPEKEIVSALTEGWSRLKSIKIESESYPQSKFSLTSVQNIFDILLPKQQLHQLHIVLPRYDAAKRRYAVELPETTSLSTLTTNAELQRVAKQHNVQFLNISETSGGKQTLADAAAINQLVDDVLVNFPKLEMLSLALMFEETQVNLLSRVLLSKLLPSITPGLKYLRYYSSVMSPIVASDSLAREFPGIAISPCDRDRFRNDFLANPADSDNESDGNDSDSDDDGFGDFDDGFEDEVFGELDDDEIDEYNNLVQQFWQDHADDFGEDDDSDEDDFDDEDDEDGDDDEAGGPERGTDGDQSNADEEK